MVEGSGDDGWWAGADNGGTWWHHLAFQIISRGPMPRHVAFIMDGNRRYSRTNGMHSVVEGHECGFRQLTRVLQWCNKFAVAEVTVYAFAIENFKRSEEEVNGLMRLAEQKFQKLLDDKARLEKERVCFRFFGNLSLLSPRLRKMLSTIELETGSYTERVLNVCLAYSSTDELARAFESIRAGVARGLLAPEQIDEYVLSKTLDSGRGGDPDLLIRTSGEQRLSDFLVWQADAVHVYYDGVLWPDFGFVNLCKALLSYQYHHSRIERLKEVIRADPPSEKELEAIQPFIDWHRNNKEQQLREYAEAVVEA